MVPIPPNHLSALFVDTRLRLEMFPEKSPVPVEPVIASLAWITAGNQKLHEKNSHFVE
jgi:hypothetical protein